LYFPPPLGFFPPGWEDLPETTIGDVTLDQAGKHRFDNEIIDGTLTVSAGRAVLEGCAVRNVVVTGADAVDAGKPLPSLIAKDCLFEQVETAGTAWLEHCTVLKTTGCARILASDSIFRGDLALTRLSPRTPSCLRFSRVPATLERRGTSVLGDFMNTSDDPVFFQISTYQDDHNVQHHGQFGDPGCGTLHPATPHSICFGAEDGGEMGAYHRCLDCLGVKAAMDKLQDFLPLGIEAVFISDSRLFVAPPVPEVPSSNG
jgi:hypothetical protein